MMGCGIWCTLPTTKASERLHGKFAMPRRPACGCSDHVLKVGSFRADFRDSAVSIQFRHSRKAL